MRVLLRATLPVEPAGTLINEGRMGPLLGEWMAKYKPEAAYFLPMDGQRTALFFVDLPDVAEMPLMTANLLQHFHARVEVTPVMRMEELARSFPPAA